MPAPTNHASLIAAGAVVAAGAVWAGTVALAPTAYQGPSTEQVQKLAQETTREMPAPEVLRPVPAPAVSVDPAPLAPAPISAPVIEYAAPAPVQRTQAGPIAVVPRPQRRVIWDPAPPRQYPAPAEDPVKNLALLGVTHDGTTDTAYLMDLSNEMRETATTGDRVFGLTVRKIEPESVRLARGSREYVLRLGEKQIPVVTPVVNNTSTGNDRSFTSQTPFNGTGRRRNRDVNAGSDENGENDIRADYLRRMRAARGQNGGDQDERNGRSRDDNDRDNGRDSRPGMIADNSRNGGRNEEDRNLDYGDPRYPYRNGYRNGYGEDPRGYPAYDAYGNPYPYAYAPYAQGGSGFGAPNAAPTNQSTSTPRRVQINPQTARRRGTNLSSSSSESGVEGPAPITNPQTQRRMGARSGSAYGEEPDNRTRRTGNNPVYPGLRSGPSR